MSEEISFDEDQSGEAAPERHDDFFSGGAPACQFAKVGDAHQGIILSWEDSQQRDMSTAAPLTWPDGKPRMQRIVTIQTNERSGDIDDDDGKRRLYIKRPSGLLTAIRKALGQSKFRVGDRLAVKYIGNGEPTQRGFNPPKQYVAKYVPANGQAQPAQPAAARGPVRPAPQPAPTAEWTNQDGAKVADAGPDDPFA